MTDNTPDFDNMTPEEIMAWMETLAKRQGASEGFTTAADMEIGEIDPDTVVIDEPGYVPYGQEGKTPAPPSKPVERQSPPPPPPAQPRPTQLPSSFPSQPVARQPEHQPEPPRPASSTPVTQVPQPPVARPTPEPTRQPERQPEPELDNPVAAQPPVNEGALAWLESLASDENEDLFNLDLSDLPEETKTSDPTQPVNPMTWLEDLARSQVAEPSLERLGAEDDDSEESEKLDPFAEGVNSMEWIETLAKRQGADPDELTTRAGMKIPVPDEDEVEAESYQPFSFDTPPAARRSPEPQGLENPADWLNSLAGSEGYSEEGVRATQPADEEDEMSLNDIQDAIQAGTVTREQMQFFLDQQAEQLAQEPEILAEDDDEEEESPLAPAELPDWLSELKPAAEAPTPTKPIDELFETPAEVPPASTGMPDWLREDLLDDDSTNLESIFASTEEDEQDAEPVSASSSAASEEYQFEIDNEDPWAEAFDLEYEQGAIDVNDIPDWYSQNVADPERLAAVEGQVEGEEAESASSLEDAPLPVERDLAAGQPEPVPSWASDYAATTPDADEASASENVFAEMPDWLREVEASVSPDDVPDWLVETISAPMDETPEPPPQPIAPPVQAQPEPPVQPPVEPKPAPQPERQPASQPQPEPVRVAAGQASEVLARARDSEQSGDLESALADYEGLIRANADLDAVVADLSQLVQSYKTTPAVYRVLGDGLMRQGKLQDALNTYREALNQL